MYKCAILGCGGRAYGHADAYRFVQRGKLVAVCDMNEERLARFAERWAVPSRYTNYEEMLETEKPDLLHVVTPPQLRASLLGVASEHGVPAAIIEKPIAIQGEDYRELRALQAHTKTKICINHQLHFHPRSLEFQREVREGNIGELRFLDASARLNLSGQGTHVLELVAAYNPGAAPTAVFGQVAGGNGLNTNHPAPDQCVAHITYDNGVRAQLLCGTNAPRMNDLAEHMHKRIAAYGTHGIRHWTMEWWEGSRPDGTMEKGTHSYGAQDVLGQAGLTDAALAWVEDDAAVHPTNLDNSLTQFNIILGIYLSALRHAPVKLPVEPDDGLIAALKTLLTG
jgi:predicted dehydrogenase